MTGPELEQLADLLADRLGTRTPARLLTAEQVADRFQVPKAQVYRLARDGTLKSVHVGRYYRFRLEDLEAWEGAGGAGVEPS